MKKRIVFCLVIVLSLPLLLTACREGGTWSFSLSEGLQVETLNDKALAYMTKNYGDIFEKSDTGNYSNGSVESHTYHIFVKVKDHPYNNIEVVDPSWDEEKGSIFLTSYPHYLFGNDAGSEWEKILKNAFPEMGYLSPKWEWTTREDIEEEFGKDIDANFKVTVDPMGPFGELLDGLTKDSTLEEYMEASSIRGILVLPAEEHMPIVSLQDAHLEKYKIESDEYLPEFEKIDSKYDIAIYIVFLENDFFNELNAMGNPAEQLIEKYGYVPENADAAEYVSKYPYMIYDILSTYERFSDDRIKAILSYVRDDGQADRTIYKWKGPVR